ncbi:pseudaminic acid cytidylyltransferase [Novipirellula caenicola]|uniref:8-amino-3,8-dideoxy-manno-octulosonate cytidylyltransferase n=1 Tax=Novipirellula caenicola TaxID=1536901 RepID=A0ABP9VZC3_9BACT
MIVAIIPARGGSKRIPGKNIRPFCGRPIIEYSINAAIESGVFDHVIVSTDCDQIADVARHCGAELPFQRPAELSGDTVGSNRVMKHAIEFCNEHLGNISRACMLTATAPFVNAQQLRDGLNMLDERRAEMTFSVATFPSPIQRAFEIRDDGWGQFVWPENETKRSQELPERYFDAGMFYWGLPEVFGKAAKFFPEHVCLYPIPLHLVHDIDTEEDWKRAELAFQVLTAESQKSTANAALVLRPATDADCLTYFDWVNDPLVRSQSRRTGPISWEEHSQWFRSQLSDDHSLLFVVATKDDAELVGQVRFDYCAGDRVWEVDFSVAANHRGRGYGAEAIRLATKELRKLSSAPIIADVKQANIASQTCFKKNGFILTSTEKKFVRFRSP